MKWFHYTLPWWCVCGGGVQKFKTEGGGEGKREEGREGERERRGVTCMRNKGSSVFAAASNSCPYSRYSAILCRKLSGSLNMTGIVIFDNSWNKRTEIPCYITWTSQAVTVKVILFCTVVWMSLFGSNSQTFSMVHFLHCVYRTQTLIFIRNCVPRNPFSDICIAQQFYSLHRV